jgi:hypothetical protein
MAYVSNLCADSIGEQLIGVGEHQGAAIKQYRPSSGRVGEVHAPDVDGLRHHLAEILNNDAEGFSICARIYANAAVHCQLRASAGLLVA